MLHSLAVNFRSLPVIPVVPVQLEDSYGSPAVVPVQPADSYGSPSIATAQPADSYGSPAIATVQPADSYGSPAIATVQPADTYGSPAVATADSYNISNLELAAVESAAPLFPLSGNSLAEETLPAYGEEEHPAAVNKYINKESD